MDNYAIPNFNINLITIPIEEYKKLIEVQMRVNIFAEHVKASDYRIEKEDCARFLGFQLQDEKND